MPAIFQVECLISEALVKNEAALKFFAENYWAECLMNLDGEPTENPGIHWDFFIDHENLRKPLKIRIYGSAYTSAEVEDREHQVVHLVDYRNGFYTRCCNADMFLVGGTWTQNTDNCTCTNLQAVRKKLDVSSLTGLTPDVLGHLSPEELAEIDEAVSDEYSDNEYSDNQESAEEFKYRIYWRTI